MLPSRGDDETASDETASDETASDAFIPLLTPLVYLLQNPLVHVILRSVWRMAMKRFAWPAAVLGLVLLLFALLQRLDSVFGHSLALAPVLAIAGILLLTGGLWVVTRPAQTEPSQP
jgi:hypothetical protein